MLKLVVRGLYLAANRADGGYLPCSDSFETAKLDDVDQRARLADILKRLPDHPAQSVRELLPWNWKAGQLQQAAV